MSASPPVATPQTALIEIRNHPALDGPNGPGQLRLAAGELAFLGGESGTGKTRLLRQLLDLEPGLEGEAWVSGRSVATLEPRELRRHLGLLPQELPNHACTGRELIDRILGFARNHGACLDASEIREWLDEMELEAHMDREISLLSGGEKRRLSLLALVVPRPAVLLLDEPEAGLDPRRRDALDLFVQRALGTGKAVLWVTHLEPAEVFREAQRYRVVMRGAA